MKALSLFFVLSLMLIVSSAFSAHCIHPSDTTVFEAQGEVIKRFGVFITIRIDNVDELEEYPQPKTKLNLLYYIDKKGPKGKAKGWVTAVEAEVYKVNEENHTIEFKILQDFADKLKKEGVDQPVKAGAKIKFQYYAIGY